MTAWHGSGTISIVSSLHATGTEKHKPTGRVADVFLLGGTVRRSPRVAGAVALDSTHVRVTFDQPMSLDSRLLNQLNYSFTTTGGYPIFVRGVAAEPVVDFPSYVDLTVTEMTNGATYNAVVASGSGAPRDRYGFSVNPTGTTASFLGIGIAPTLVSVAAVGPNRADVKFSEPILDEASARDPATYAFDNGLVVLSILGIVGDTVQLVTSDQVPGELYTLTIG